MTIIKNIGKVIIISSFLVSLNPYLLLFTIPSFLIGIILIWISKLNLKSKIIWSIIPVLFWYPSFHLFMYLSASIGTATAQKLDFIFQDNFEGSVIVISKIPCGQLIREVNGREELFIPKNGILLYQGEIKDGYVNHKYYKLNSNGKKMEIPDRANYMYYESEKNKPTTNSIGVWILKTGSRVLSNKAPIVEYSYMELLVSSKDSSDKYFSDNFSNNFENLTDSLVRGCN